MLNNLINLVVGLFFLVGAFFALINKNNKNLISFSVGLAFIVLIILLFIDILPEAYELLNSKIIYLIIGLLIGLAILFILERIIPHHDHYNEIKHHENHLNHIGLMTSIALIIHNVIEGMGIYSVVQNDLKAGLLYAFGVGLHNIPFGIEITAMLKENKNNKVMYIHLFLLTISTFLGGFIIYLFNGLINNFILGMLLSITIGMIIYLVVFELFIELKENFNKYSIIGLLSGVIIMFIGVLW